VPASAITAARIATPNFCLISLTPPSGCENPGVAIYYFYKTSQFRKSYIAFLRLAFSRLAEIDASARRNVSAFPNFQSTTCFYLQNTATVDFVARKFFACDE
jgi:hypothetical protein